MLYPKLLMSVFCATIAAAETADTHFHAWASYFGDHPLQDSRWGLHLEAQMRRHQGLNQWQQLLLRPGVNLEVNRRLIWTEGYAFVQAHRYCGHPAAPRTLPEHRIWHQASVKYKTGKVSWNNRLRFENRFVGTPDSKYRFENRFRIWQRGVLPVSRSYFIAAYDEMFFYVKPFVSQSVLDQNRAYIALGRRLGPDAELEIGYLNQTIWQRNGLVRENNNTLQFSLVNRKHFGGRSHR